MQVEQYHHLQEQFELQVYLQQVYLSSIQTHQPINYISFQLYQMFLQLPIKQVIQVLVFLPFVSFSILSNVLLLQQGHQQEFQFLLLLFHLFQNHFQQMYLQQMYFQQQNQFVLKVFFSLHHRHYNFVLLMGQYHHLHQHWQLLIDNHLYILHLY